ncbi:hypothetical protein DFR70_11666 [Nocardia tenerifensis]|uniref:Secreted protein n=1 Tax=Nocardia tenerifensis TaxID=228006 RepID=A0A318JVG1_9NOCA|nr:hypothetical protein [Nocardia tenerifensis]PXX57836.1 hypothetical protein DFR70_11666 [Nocardia tenerifensis]
MRGTKATLLVAVLTLAVGAGAATADPADLPSAHAPVSSPLALLTLTTIPNGWQTRVDLRPQLEVSGDGRAVKTPDALAPERNPENLPKRVNGRIPPEVLAAALAETKALATVDFGMPTVTDQGSQIIDLMPQAPEEDAHLVVYAPEFTEGLAPEQQAARKRFGDLYRKLLDSFVADA